MLLNLASTLVAASLSNASHRPPAVPLITHDPYFSLWSRTDKLTDGPVCHWTGTPQPLTSLIKVDGKVFRLMGSEPGSIPAMAQTGLAVTPTRTTYSFSGEGIEVALRFTSPLLPNDLDLFSRPASYITWSVRATDSASHKVSVYFDASAKLAVNEGTQEVTWKASKLGDLNLLKVSSVDQPVLEKRGDNLRIDWGHLLLSSSGQAFFDNYNRFIDNGTIDRKSPAQSPSEAAVAPNAGTILDFGTVRQAVRAQHIVLGYDDEYSIQLMHHDLRPYWRRNGMTGEQMVAQAEKDYASVESQCEKFDRELMADMEKVGGASYAYLGALAYRQGFAAQKVVADANGQPLMFSKENFSNGCIGTVDVLYPAAPQMLLFSPTLMKASMTPLMEYAASPRWKFPFAPHDMGQYPKANGQVYGGGEFTEENQMPVEESGNMIIILAALAKIEGNAKYSEKYWPQISKWAEYLASKGFDPERQLCTDDFAGHLGHNVNLSVKAIVALDSYGYLAATLGHAEEAKKYRALAKEFALRWVKEARDGDHYRLAFDQPGTWSQKYNLVWDRLLGFKSFPASVATAEMKYYRTKQIHPYGLPLDNRRTYTKLDWEVWTATLTGKRDDFEVIVDPIVAFLNASPSRVPMSDWYDTVSAKQEGFQARSVVGGVFIKMLDSSMWAKYAKRDKNTASNWAALPVEPKMGIFLPTAKDGSTDWKWVEHKPADGWMEFDYDDSKWGTDKAGFGEGDNRGGEVRTPWRTRDIWLRKTFNVGAMDPNFLRLILAHDDGAEVYINGIRALVARNASGYETYKLPKKVIASLKATNNIIAIHCHDDGGDRYIDAGLGIVDGRS